MKPSEHIFYQVTAHWIDALIKDDFDVFDEFPGQRQAFNQFVSNFIEGGTVLSVGQSPYFSKHHDAGPYGMLPCDVVDVKVSYGY
jgi:hypothetical protein